MSAGCRSLIRAACCCGAWIGAAAACPPGVTPGAYRITAETLLPHLEENLRDANTRDTLCLCDARAAGATALFPILRHAAFAGCRLAAAGSSGEHSEFELVCQNPQAATGVARVSAGPASIDGVLDIKMGAKNMTLSQRIAGVRLGRCEAGE